jgi:hypothetical protein
MILQRRAEIPKHTLTIEGSYSIHHGRVLRIKAHDSQGVRWTITINREDAKALSSAMLNMRFDEPVDETP